MTTFAGVKGFSGDSYLTVAEMLRAIWRHRLIVVAVTITSALFALVYLRFATYTYTASLYVTPVESGAADGLMSQLGGLGGLASLAGVSLPGARGSGAFQLYLESLQSRPVADELANNAELMYALFSAEWDSSTKQWRRPSGLSQWIKSTIYFLIGADGYQWHPPDGPRLQEYLKRNITVMQNPKKSVVTIAYSNENPELASLLLSSLHKVADSQIRQRTMLRVKENITYLTGKLEEVRNVEHQRAIAQALSDQEKVRMMANSSVAFAAEPFGEAKSSFEPTRPRPFVVLISMLALALFSSGAGIIIWTVFSARHESLNTNA
jgi:uncharacterized protein involved in exopolysaccharide biosynthesis